jgi:hypothetical protein
LTHTINWAQQPKFNSISCAISLRRRKKEEEHERERRNERKRRKNYEIYRTLLYYCTHTSHGLQHTRSDVSFFAVLLTTFLLDH